MELHGRSIASSVDSPGKFAPAPFTSLRADNPLDTAAQKLLIPAALSIIRGLHGRKDKG